MLNFLDTISKYSGRILAWLILSVMIFTCVVVILRYAFGDNNVIFYQELVIYLHASAFMLAAAWVLRQDAHVRVDVLYRLMDSHAKAWVNVIGTLVFLLPVSCFLLLTSFEFASQSWAVRETSAEADGIPAVFLLKSVIPVASGLLILQGVAEVIRYSIILYKND